LERKGGRKRINEECRKERKDESKKYEIHEKERTKGGTV
jgi:hypothetical protein